MEGHQTTDYQNVSSELYFLIAKFLCNGPCKNAAEALVKELETSRSLPKRRDWLGNSHDQTLNELERKYPHIGPDHLLKICLRIGPILDREFKPSIPGVVSLLGAGRQSLLRTVKDLSHRSLPISDYGCRYHGNPLQDPAGWQGQHNIVRVLQGRENSGPLKRWQAAPPKLYNKQQLYCRTLGHLSAVYCLLFDRTGKYVITGADDLLVKIWSAIDGRLLGTFRGASSEIADIAVNLENTLLAAGSVDKILRVWCLQTGSPVAILSGHTGMITSVHFCPLTNSSARYLVTTSTDGSVAFWSYKHLNNGKYFFVPKPILYNEKLRPGQAQMICASFSPGGMFLAAGSADHHVRVYMMEGEEGPHRILEMEAHSDRVDSIQWANSGLRFISGSKDGTALVWQFTCQQWKSLQLDMSTKLSRSDGSGEDPKLKLKVTVVCWNATDVLVITAVNDNSLKVWNSNSGELIQVLRGHKDEIYVLEAHPIDPHVLLSAGHDGQLFIWDVIAGTIVKSFQNSIDGHGHGAIFDAKWSPDGNMMAASDSHGHILMFGFGSGNERYKKLPKELFFHTDYRPLIRDSTHTVLDEQTQVAPHLMPPPFLVDIDGNPYPPAMQRLVPGRENCHGEQLIPNIAVGVGGQQEVIEGIPGNETPRSNIDEMIELLAHRQNAHEGGDPSQAARQLVSPRSVRRHGLRRSGDVEGVRQSSGNWQRGNFNFCKIHALVKSLDVVTYNYRKNVLSEFAIGELSEYRREQQRKPLEPPPEPQSTRTISNRRHNRNHRNQQQHNYRTRATRENYLGDNEFENPENLPISPSGSSTSDQNNDDSTAREEDLSGSSSSENESSEYSDWIADSGVNLEPPKRLRRRPVKKPTPPSAPPTNDRSQVRSTKKVPPPPATSLGEIPEIYRPSEWLSEVIPRKAPYYPQMGDEVVYFRQGHQLYLNAVRNKNVYELNPRSEPWSRRNIQAQELVKVVGIKYEIRPPRLCCLKLALMNPNGTLTGDNFTIKYHDMADVLDFLVLKQTYDIAVERNWKVGDRFRCMIDDCWWLGVIESQNPLESNFPDSKFLCFRVRWDNGEYERMSPWDLEPVVTSRLPSEVGGAVQVLPEEIQAILYQPRAEEWPMGDRDATCRRILNGLDQVMGLAIAEPFIAPVDINQYPTYALAVEYPIDLSTIKARFENRFYRRVTSAQFDVRYIATNAEKFNEPDSQIVKKARIVTDLCLRIMKDRNAVNVHAVYHQLMDSYHSTDSDSEIDVESPGPSRVQRSQRRQNPNRSAVKRFSSYPTDWRRECRELLDLLWTCNDAAPFREPVDALEHPDYYQVIDTPMDLRTVKEDLLGDNYQNPLEFCKDVRLIFTNSKNYNTNKRSRIYAMTVRLSAMFEEHMESIIYNWKAARRRELTEKRNLGRGTRASTSGLNKVSARFPRSVNDAGPSRYIETGSDNSDSYSEPEVKPLRRMPLPKKSVISKKSSSAASRGNDVKNGHLPQAPNQRPSLRLKFTKLPSKSETASSYAFNSQNSVSDSSSSSDSNSSSFSDSRRRRQNHISVQNDKKRVRISRNSAEENMFRPSCSGVMRTRNQGQQRVRYLEREDDEEEENEEDNDNGGDNNVEDDNDDDDDDDDDSGVDHAPDRKRKSEAVRPSRTTLKPVRYRDSDDSDVPVVSKRTRISRKVIQYHDESEESDNQEVVNRPRRNSNKPLRYQADADSEEDTRPSRTSQRIYSRQHSDDSDDSEPVHYTRGRHHDYTPLSDHEYSQRAVRTRNLRHHDTKENFSNRSRRARSKPAHYAEDSDSSDLLPEISISSRGRVRKLTPRARALFTK